MKYAIIGLGNYGSVLAEELSALGHEVVGADIDANKVDRIKDQITTTYRLDATDDLSLSSMPLEGVDVVIVAVGENFGASVKIVALLKQMKIRHIYARAIDPVHETILQAFNVERILKPEEESARSFVQTMDLGVEIESFKVDNEFYVLKFDLPKRFIGAEINSLNLESEFSIKILSVIRAKATLNFLGVSFVEPGVINKYTSELYMEQGDQLVCYGKYQDFHKLWKAI